MLQKHGGERICAAIYCTRSLLRLQRWLRLFLVSSCAECKRTLSLDIKVRQDAPRRAYTRKFAPYSSMKHVLWTCSMMHALFRKYWSVQFSSIAWMMLKPCGNAATRSGIYIYTCGSMHRIFATMKRITSLKLPRLQKPGDSVQSTIMRLRIYSKILIVHVAAELFFWHEKKSWICIYLASYNGHAVLASTGVSRVSWSSSRSKKTWLQRSFSLIDQKLQESTNNNSV